MTTFFYQLLAGRVQLLVEEGHGHIEAVDGLAAHIRLDMLPIGTAGQEREAPGGVSHNHAGQAHKLQLGGGSGGLQDVQLPGGEAGQQPVGHQGFGGGGHLSHPLSTNEHGLEF